jgi:hypothetical protein
MIRIAVCLLLLSLSACAIPGFGKSEPSFTARLQCANAGHTGEGYTACVNNASRY